MTSRVKQRKGIDRLLPAKEGHSDVLGDSQTMARRNGDSGEIKVVGERRMTAYRRSDQFLAGLEDATGVTFISHVHADPDGLGSMLGLAHLVATCLGKPVRLDS